MERGEIIFGVVKEYTVSGYSYSPEGSVDGVPKSTEVMDLPNGSVAYIATVLALCNDAIIVGSNDADGEKETSAKKKRTIAWENRPRRRCASSRRNWEASGCRNKKKSRQ